MNDPRTAARTARVGDHLPDFRSQPITRRTLALYAGASGDHNPLHIDTDAARAAGFADVFAHGMLLMAYAARMLTDWAGPGALLQFKTRFMATGRVGDVLVCGGEVMRIDSEGGRRIATVAVTATDANGEVKLSGEARVAAE